MLFKPYHIDQIRDGEKTVTRREWERRQVKPGGVYIAATEMFVSDDEADCYVRVTDVYEQPLGEMDDEDARREGDYETLEEFRDGYEKVYGEGSWDPEKVVWVVEFEYVGRSRPEEQTKLVTDGGVDRDDAEVTLDDLPRFAASKELVTRYGDDWATWAFLGTGVVFLGVSALAFSDIAEPPAVKVLPAVLSFGLFAFIAGMFVGVLWSGLIDDALEREAMLDE